MGCSFVITFGVRVKVDHSLGDGRLEACITILAFESRITRNGVFCLLITVWKSGFFTAFRMIYFVF